MSLQKKALGVFIVLVIIGGAQHWKKSVSYHDVRAQMLEFCGGLSTCEAALTKRIDSCFDQSYGMGSKRLSGGLDRTAFVQCMDRRGGGELLTLHQ